MEDIISKSILEVINENNIANCCFIGSVLVAKALEKKGITSVVIPGFLVSFGMFTHRHIWVHTIPGNTLIECSNNKVPLGTEYHVTLPKKLDRIDYDTDVIEETKKLESLVEKHLIACNLINIPVIGDWDRIIDLYESGQKYDIAPVWKQIIGQLREKDLI